MRPLISFMHISLDGFVAGPNGEMNWITVNQDIFDHVGQRIRETDTALYGRVTWQMMESYWPTAGTKPNATRHDIEHAAWYRDVHKVVLSTALKPEGLTHTTVISDNLTDRVTNIKNQPGSEILVFGSPSATHALIEADLIDGYWLFVNPVILGHGIPLFTGNRPKTTLSLITSKTFSCGVTELSYLVNRP